MNGVDTHVKYVFFHSITKKCNTCVCTPFLCGPDAIEMAAVRRHGLGEAQQEYENKNIKRPHSLSPPRPQRPCRVAVQGIHEAAMVVVRFPRGGGRTQTPGKGVGGR